MISAPTCCEHRWYWSWDSYFRSGCNLLQQNMRIQKTGSKSRKVFLGVIDVYYFFPFNLHHAARWINQYRFSVLEEAFPGFVLRLAAVLMLANADSNEAVDKADFDEVTAIHLVNLYINGIRDDFCQEIYVKISDKIFRILLRLLIFVVF